VSDPPGVDQGTANLDQLRAHRLSAIHRQLNFMDIAFHPVNGEKYREQSGHGYGQHRNALGAQGHPPPAAQYVVCLAVFGGRHPVFLF